MSLSARRELTASTVSRYRSAGKKEKGVILKEFVAATGYERKYAISVLNKPVVAGCPGRAPRFRRPTYGPDVRHPLIELWKLSDGQCGKLLVAALPHLIDRLRVFGELELCPEVERKLRTISPATIDRILNKVRRQGIKGISTTRSGSLLKHQIPIRTFSDWSDLQPGFAEIDLVAHCAEDGGGEFAYTLTLTDIATAWVELAAIKNRSQIAVTDALELIRNRLPFTLRGIDCDNGSEFINHHLNRYCEEHQIKFTRGRPYRKNDQCYVEQKNGHVVRKLAGYARYESQASVMTLNRIYDRHRLFLNFFQPCRKLIEKVRTGAKVNKRYDDPQTPYARLLASNVLSKTQAAAVTAAYENINPADVRRRLDDLGYELPKHAVKYIEPSTLGGALGPLAGAVPNTEAAPNGDVHYNTEAF